MTGSERLALLDAVIYADAFGCAVTLDELWRFARAPVERETLQRVVERDPAVVAGDGVYCLADRPALLDARRERLARAERLERRARRVARVLRHVPFVRGIALTGSAAAGDANDGADADLLVIVARGRMATVFLVLGSVSRLLRRRLFCPNYYLADDRLAMPPGDVYLARELAQARPLTGAAARLRAANPWVADVFPNARPPGDPVAPAGGRVQRAGERVLRGTLGERLERFAAGVAATRLRTHYRGEPPADVRADLADGDALRFHASGVATATLRRYAERRAEVAERLARST